VFGQKANLMRHYSVHGADKKYKCHYPNCVREFADSSSFNRHLIVHSGAKPYECDWPSCGYRCNDHSALKVRSLLINTINDSHYWNYRFINADTQESDPILASGRVVVCLSFRALRWYVIGGRIRERSRSNAIGPDVSLVRPPNRIFVNTGL
jgi:hypothetical protein